MAEQSKTRVISLEYPPSNPFICHLWLISIISVDLWHHINYPCCYFTSNFCTSFLCHQFFQVLTQFRKAVKILCFFRAAAKCTVNKVDMRRRSAYIRNACQSTENLQNQYEKGSDYIFSLVLTQFCNAKCLSLAPYRSFR